MAIVANAQVISFTETAAKGSLNGKTFGSEGFVLTVTDKAETGKLEIDANNANFGTLADYQSFTHRLKTGGKSSSSNNMSLSIPADGTLKVYARTASKDSERPIVITQNGTEVFNQKFVDSQAATENYTASDGSEKVRTVFPIYTCEVKAGTADITYPDNAVNFYCFELVSSAAPSASTYEATITSDPENDYYSGYEAFDMKQVISALGLADEAALKELLATPGNVYYKSATGELSNAYTGNANEFWMNANGVPQGYGDEGTCWYAGLYYDEAGSDESTGETWESEFYCKVGQMPNYFGKVYTDSELNVVLVLMNGDKQIEVSITLKVNAAPALPEIAEPTKSLAGLTIVKEYDLDAVYYLGKTNEGKTLKFNLDGIYDALGVDATALDANIESVTLVQGVVSEGEGDATVYSIGDALITPAEGAGGAWFGRYTNFIEATGEEENIYLNMPKTWGTGNNSVYTQNITLNEGEFSFVTGQYGSLITTDSQDYIEFYIVNGTKAVKLKMNLKATEEPRVSFDEWVKVGSETDEIKHIIGGAGGSFTLDLDKVAELLGCDPGDVAFNILADEASLSNDHTATKGGCWMTKEGYSIPWGVEGYAMYVEPNTNMTFTDFSVGFNDAAWTLGDEQNIKLLFNFGGKYFEKVLNVKIVEKEASGVDPDSNFEIVSQITINQQIVPSSAYYGNESEEIQLKMQKNIGIDKIVEMIGDGNYKVYGQDAPATADAYPTISDAYTYGVNAGFNTGFWMAEPVAELGEEYATTSYAGSWPECPYGIEFDFTNGIIGFDQIPNRHSVGDSFRSTFYWVNTTNNKAIKLNVNIKYVEEYTDDDSDADYAPSIETINYVVKESEYDDDLGAYVLNIDMTEAYNKLGITADEAEAVSVIAPINEFTYTEFDIDANVAFTENGFVTDDEMKTHILAAITNNDGKIAIAIDALDLDLTSETSEAKATVRIGIAYDGKSHLFVVNLNGPAVSISAVTTQSASAAKKVLRDGKVMIIKGANEFGVSGALIK